MLFLFFSLERYWPSLSVRNELLRVLILFHFESAVLFLRGGFFLQFEYCVAGALLRIESR